MWHSAQISRSIYTMFFIELSSCPHCKFKKKTRHILQQYYVASRHAFLQFFNIMLCLGGCWKTKISKTRHANTLLIRLRLVLIRGVSKSLKSCLDSKIRYATILREVTSPPMIHIQYMVYSSYQYQFPIQSDRRTSSITSLHDLPRSSKIFRRNGITSTLLLTPHKV